MWRRTTGWCFAFALRTRPHPLAEILHTNVKWAIKGNCIYDGGGEINEQSRDDDRSFVAIKPKQNSAKAWKYRGLSQSRRKIVIVQFVFEVIDLGQNAFELKIGGIDCSDVCIEFCYRVPSNNFVNKVTPRKTARRSSRRALSSGTGRLISRACTLRSSVSEPAWTGTNRQTYFP